MREYLSTTKTRIAQMALICTTVGLGVLSCYSVWGWLTVADVRAYCEEHGLDFNEVITELGSSRIGDVKMDRQSEDEWSVDVEITEGSPLDRLAPRVGEASIYRDGANEGFRITEVNFFTPFARVSDNVLNTAFVAGLGYLISLVVLLLMILRSQPIPAATWLLRSVAGGAVAALLWILILSSASLLWSNVGSPRSLSLGVVAAVGAVYCERFEDWLRALIPGDG